ncbi:TVP38/TMEM64 family protein [Aquabacterium lacunae]|uniref:TVP38/TMEM64 family membrane protein n=1 Tax=Aquabacterium lacunae TaxID=2528630 RepID=A0A4Q9H2X3_9BURK|nr:VTT domain-containing protein [Aquabacterium lacunae]TBO34388.1 TVP38/TMEM64 family protein [Aquabacterium lacunae]
MSASPALKGLRWAVLLLYVGVIAGVSWALRDDTFRQHLEPAALARWGKQLLAMPMGSALVLGGYVLACLMAAPVALLVTAGALIFGPWPGMAYALCGMVCGATVTYMVGRFLGAQAMDSWSNTGKLKGLAALVERRGFWAVVFVRAFPVGPFVLINLSCGALRVRLRDYVLGTALGLLPGTIIISLFTEQLTRLLSSATSTDWAWLAAAVITVVLAGLWWKRRRPQRAAT